MGQTVEISIVNTHPDWFAPFPEIPDELAGSLAQIKKNQGKVDLEKLIGDERPLTEVVVASVIDWRAQFHQDKIGFAFYSAEQGCVPTGFGELSLWYADKYGVGRPDYLGVGREISDESGTVGREGFAMSVDRYDRLVQLLRLVGNRIERKPDTTLIVEDVTLTPKPPKHWYDQRTGQPHFIDNTVLNIPPKSDGEESLSIDIFGLYGAFHAHFTSLLGDHRVKPSLLPAVPWDVFHAELDRQGVAEEDRRKVRDGLTACGYITYTDKGTLLTDTGVAAWNAILGHI